VDGPVPSLGTLISLLENRQDSWVRFERIRKTVTQALNPAPFQSTCFGKWMRFGGNPHAQSLSICVRKPAQMP